MPTYEYRCRDCAEHLEVVQSFRDDPLTSCGICGGDLRKVFSASGIIFKGSGYYVNDTRKPSPSESGSSSGDDGKTAKSDKTDTGEAKPATNGDSGKQSSGGSSSAAESA
jgi:putative FmdB family regulatory protein